MSRVDESLPLLTTELLAEYEGSLRDLGVQVEGGFASGLGEAEMAAVLAPLPLELAVEARVWWGWRNGFVPGAPPYFDREVRVRELDRVALQRFVDWLPTRPGRDGRL